VGNFLKTRKDFLKFIRTFEIRKDFLKPPSLFQVGGLTDLIKVKNPAYPRHDGSYTRPEVAWAHVEAAYSRKHGETENIDDDTLAVEYNDYAWTLGLVFYELTTGRLLARASSKENKQFFSAFPQWVTYYDTLAVEQIVASLCLGLCPSHHSPHLCRCGRTVAYFRRRGTS
jgi:hypothetical protein